MSVTESDQPQCGVCLGGFVQPRVLPCGHSFCTNCILQCIRHSNGRVLACPMCKKDIRFVTEDEIETFPRNFELEKVLQLYAGIRNRVPQSDQGSRRQPSSRSATAGGTSAGHHHERVGESGQGDSDSEEEEAEQLRLAMQMSLQEVGSTVDADARQEDEDLARAIYNSQIESNPTQQQTDRGSSQNVHIVNLKVKNLHPSVTIEQFIRLFSPFGRIHSSRVTPLPHGRSKGYGFVRYEDPAAAREAMRQMDGQCICGWPIRVDVAQGSYLPP